MVLCRKEGMESDAQMEESTFVGKASVTQSQERWRYVSRYKERWRYVSRYKGSCAVFNTECLSAQCCVILCDSMDCSPSSSSVHGDSPGKNYWRALLCHALLQGIFPTQESNPGLPHCGQILYQLSHKGIPRVLEC